MENTGTVSRKHFLKGCLGYLTIGPLSGLLTLINASGQNLKLVENKETNTEVRYE